MSLARLDPPDRVDRTMSIGNRRGILAGYRDGILPGRDQGILQ